MTWYYADRTKKWGKRAAAGVVSGALLYALYRVTDNTQDAGTLEAISQSVGKVGRSLFSTAHGIRFLAGIVNGVVGYHRREIIDTFPASLAYLAADSGPSALENTLTGEEFGSSLVETLAVNAGAFFTGAGVKYLNDFAKKNSQKSKHTP